MHTPAENLVLHVLMQLVVVICAARVGGIVCRRIGQPVVCGEIAAGLLLGPSFLGRIAPSAFTAVFDDRSSVGLMILSQIGLILLLFLIGLEFDFTHLRRWGKAAAAVSMAGIMLPFALGTSLATVLYAVVGSNTSKIGFMLFIGTALSITAIPTLGRIMIELNISRSDLGALTISAAAIDDATGWILLTIAVSTVQAHFDPVRIAQMILEIVVLVLTMFFVVRPLLSNWIAKKTRESESNFPLSVFTLVLVFVMCAAVITNFIGIFSIFGAFLAGAVLSDHPVKTAVMKRFQDFTLVFFLPIFFTYTGLRTDIGSMTDARLWLLCGAVLIAAIFGKCGGCALAARWSGLSWRNAASVGVMMNTRGLMELIVVNAGFELGVISRSVFFMLVLMAVVTTYITTPMLRRILHPTELFRFSIEAMPAELSSTPNRVSVVQPHA